MLDINRDITYPTQDELYSLGVTPKDSLLYKDAIKHNKQVRDSLDAQVEPLTSSLEEATHLPQNVKEKFIEQSRLYLQDMQANLFRNQFSLSVEYPTYSADEWNDFLSDRIVAVYINKHKRTLLKTAAEDNLADPYSRNKRDNLNLINSIKEEEAREEEKNVVILRIPDIYDTDGDNE